MWCWLAGWLADTGNLQALCGLDLGDLFSPDYVADPNLLGPWDSVCLPQGCEPCRSGLAKLAVSASPDDREADSNVVLQLLDSSMYECQAANGHWRIGASCA